MRFRRERVLIVGCGDVGLRVAQALNTRKLALTSSPQRQSLLRAQAIGPLLGNLDEPKTLQRLASVATRVVYLAPPNAAHEIDTRVRNFLHAMRKRQGPRSVVYASTSGVYGDCLGLWVAEHRSVNPQTPRARRRVDAEDRMCWFGRSGAVRVHILRVPGIYANDREGGTPRERLLKGTPVLQAQDDVYTNHIHADDLARAVVAALWRGKHQRTTNVNDDTQMRMGEYFDWAASIYGLPKPPRIAPSQMALTLSPMQQSFMLESRRLDNTRLKRELRLVLRYPTVDLKSK